MTIPGGHRMNTGSLQLGYRGHLRISCFWQCGFSEWNRINEIAVLNHMQDGFVKRPE